MELQIEPPPTPDEERAIRAALAEDEKPPSRRGRWVELGDGAPLEDPGRDAGVVEA